MRNFEKIAMLIFLGIVIFLLVSLFLSVFRAMPYGPMNCTRRYIDSLEPVISSRWFCPYEESVK